MPSALTHMRKLQLRSRRLRVTLQSLIGAVGPIRMARGLRALAVTGLTVFTAAACIAAPQPAPAPTVAPTPTPEPLSPSEVIAQAAVAMGSAKSMSFEITHPSGGTALADGLTLEKAAGSVVAPGRVAVQADVMRGSESTRVESVTIGELNWMLDPQTMSWAETSPEDNLLSGLDPVGLITNILGLVRKAQYDYLPAPGQDVVLNGTINAYALSALGVDVIDANALDITLTIDHETYALKQVRISGALQESDGPGAVRLIAITGLNSGIRIDPPE